MAHKNKVLVPFFNSDAAREKGAASVGEREHQTASISSPRKRAAQLLDE